MTEIPVSALILESGVRKNLYELEHSTSLLSQAHVRFYLDSVLSTLNSVRRSCNEPFFSCLSQEERKSFHKALIQIEDCVHTLQQQLEDSPQKCSEQASQNDTERQRSLSDVGLPDVTFSTEIPTSTIDVIMGRPIDDIESVRFLKDSIADTAVRFEKTSVETKAPPNEDGRSTVRRLSQQAGSLFSRNGLAIHPKPTTIAAIKLNDEKSKPQMKSFAQQPPGKSEDVSATEGWIKVSQITELVLATK